MRTNQMKKGVKYQVFYTTQKGKTVHLMLVGVYLGRIQPRTMTTHVFDISPVAGTVELVEDRIEEVVWTSQGTTPYANVKV